MNSGPSAVSSQQKPQHSLYDRFATLYADFRLHRFPDDRAQIAAVLDVGTARNLLELGCGPGYYAATFAAAFPSLSVTGIDRAPAQIALAMQRARSCALPNLRFAVGDARSLRSFGRFDRIVASRLLMVVPERERVLAEARRALAPGGLLLLAEPARPGTGVLPLLRRVADAARDGVAYVEPPREHYFSATSFRAFIASQPWASVVVWEANGYRYARCRAHATADLAVERVSQ